MYHDVRRGRIREKTSRELDDVVLEETAPTPVPLRPRRGSTPSSSREGSFKKKYASTSAEREEPAAPRASAQGGMVLSLASLRLGGDLDALEEAVRGSSLHTPSAEHADFGGRTSVYRRRASACWKGIEEMQ